jgi:Fe-S cluster assembly scaffold protein SufB
MNIISKFEVYEDLKGKEFILKMREKRTVLLVGNCEGVKFRLAGEGAELVLLGVAVGRNKEEVKVKVEVEHAAPKTRAEIILRGVVYGGAKVNLYGSVKVVKGAKGADDSLQENLLLIGEKARGEVYPEMEIEEDNVVAKHAATVGRVDQEQLFYLASRGLTESEAEKLLIKGFLRAIFERIPEGERDKIGESGISTNDSEFSPIIWENW